MRKTLATVGAILVSGAGLVVADDLSQRELKTIGEGRGLYLQHCAACHGLDARGMDVGNPVAAPDLTAIARRDGCFDRLHVKNHIAWGADLPAGVERKPDDMPKWVVVLARRGSERNDHAAQMALLRLVRYVEFVQRDEP
jgi:mono/diheme cytochrome c family protein